MAEIDPLVIAMSAHFSRETRLEAWRKYETAKWVHAVDHLGLPLMSLPREYGVFEVIKSRNMLMPAQSEVPHGAAL